MRYSILKWYLLLILSMMFSVGCFVVGKPREVTSVELTGTWMGSVSRDFYSDGTPEDSIKKPALNLLEDGSYVLDDFPVCWKRQSWDCTSEVERLSGQWHLYKFGAGATMVFDLGNNSFNFDPEYSNSEMNLYFYVGDPDMGKWIKFSKVRGN